MTYYIIGMVLEVAMGLVIGFYLTDKKRGLSINDIKLTSILLLLLSAFLLLKGTMDFALLLHLIFAFILICGGILLGEYLRILLANKIVHKTVGKDTVHKRIHKFLEQAKLVAQGEECSLKLQENLKDVLHQIELLKSRTSSVRQPQLFHHLVEIGNSCKDLARVSVYARDNDACDIIKYEQLSQELALLSWQTLSSFESKVHKEMLHPVHAVSYTIKAQRMK